MSIGPDGGVYPCGQFNGLEEFYLGNIHREGFKDIMRSAGMQRLLQRVPENIEPCSHCEYVEICHSGCTVGAVNKNGDIMGPDYYCAGRKFLFKHIIDTLDRDVGSALSQKCATQQGTTGFMI